MAPSRSRLLTRPSLAWTPVEPCRPMEGWLATRRLWSVWPTSTQSQRSSARPTVRHVASTQDVAESVAPECAAAYDNCRKCFLCSRVISDYADALPRL